MRKVLFALALVALVSCLAQAATTGSLSGTVVDDEDRSLPGVTVILSSDLLTGGRQVAITDANGAFRFNRLPAGLYTVRAELPGFVSGPAEIRVIPAREARITIQMGPQEFADQIAVTAAVPVVNSTQVNSGESYNQEFLENASIGVDGRDYLIGGGLPVDREQHGLIADNEFQLAAAQPLSTFSIDVDTASYANIRRMISRGQRPPVDAVRIEELINYFDYGYPEPAGDVPFSVSAEVAACPWSLDHRVVRIGLRARSVDWEQRPASNLVFLLDVSGSMKTARKLPLMKKALRMLVEILDKNDRVAMVVYAGAAGLVLDSTSCDRQSTVLDALDSLSAGGSTAGGAGIELAYSVAQENFISGGLNRVILCTDGDFNVGVSDQGSLVRMIRSKAEGGVFLTVLGFGMSNLQDSTLESLADEGNGNYGYIDSELEARKVLVNEAGGTMITVAKDVKIQVEFNPAQVNGYRLVGYSNRMLAARDFSDDTKDAGEIGAGHTVTALYEVVPVGVEVVVPGVDELRYQGPAEPAEGAVQGELLHVKLRYKEPTGDTSRLVTLPVGDSAAGLDSATEDFHFAAAVAAFGMILRDSKHRGESSFDLVNDLASGGLGKDSHGYRADFLELVTMTRGLGTRKE